MALKRPPSRIEPVAGVPEVFDYPRDIQPIWDRHCVACHSAEKPAGPRGADRRQQRMVHAELLRAVGVRSDQPVLAAGARTATIRPTVSAPGPAR